MSVDVDPLASLRAWGTVVELGGREYPLRAALAVEWLPILMIDPMDLSAIIPGMVEGDLAGDLEDALIRGDVSLDEIEQVCRDVITMAAGREWWWACNLLASVAGAWMVIFGNLVAKGMDVSRMPLGALLDAMYAECAARMDKDHLRDFERQLNTPPIGLVPVINEDVEAANFVALMNSGV